MHAMRIELEQVRRHEEDELPDDEQAQQRGRQAACWMDEFGRHAGLRAGERMTEKP